MTTHEDQINELLFREVDLCGLKLKNRIAMAPMTRSLSPGGIPTEELARRLWSYGGVR